MSKSAGALGALLLAAAAATSGAAQAADDHATFAFTGDSSGANPFTAQLLLSFTDGRLQVLLNATQRGWVDQNGHSAPENGFLFDSNFIAGQLDSVDMRDVFAFDLSGVSAEISFADLILKQPSNGFIGDSPLTYDLWDVSTSTANWAAGGVAFYNDLGSGTSLGSKVIDPSSEGNLVVTIINPTGVADLNAARGGHFSIGGAVEGGPVVTGSIPEPAAWTLMIGGFGLAGAMLRRRRAAAYA